MFEDTLVVSQVRRSTFSEYWATAASFSLQIAIGTLAIVLPLLHPAKITAHQPLPHVLIAPLHRLPLAVQQVKSATHLSNAALPATTPSIKTAIFRTPFPQNDSRPFILPVPGKMAGSAPIGSTLTDTHGPLVTVAASSAGNALHVSSGVSAGMLLVPIQPVYPEIARIAHVQGTVVVEAVITSAGTIDKMYAVSGPPMLRQAALDAIRSARYRPYRLNGSPIEVQTTISVSFHLGS